MVWGGADHGRCSGEGECGGGLWEEEVGAWQGPFSCEEPLSGCQCCEGAGSQWLLKGPHQVKNSSPYG